MPTIAELTRAKTQRCAQCRHSHPLTPQHYRVTKIECGFNRYASRCLACEAKGDASGAFERVLREMEAAHGPYATWSRAAHREHTTRLYQVLGWHQRVEATPAIFEEPDREVVLPLDPGHPLFRPPVRSPLATDAPHVAC